MARIRVYEGYIDEAAFEGEPSPAVARLFAGAEKARPSKLPDLERRQALASDMPGFRLRTRLEPVLDDPARHRLVVSTEVKRFTASIYSDNRGAHTQGPWQVYGWGGVNSALVSGDQISLGVLTTPVDTGELTYAELAYSAPTPGGGRLRAAISGSESENGQDAAFGSRSRSLGIRYLHPLTRTRKQSLWATAAFDARGIDQRWPGAPTAEDQLRVLRVGIVGDRAWRSARTNFGIQVSHGLKVLGATRTVSNRHSRWDADGGFWKVNAQASHYTDLGRRFGLYLAAEGQYAPDPVLASEEFAVGAQPFGRAYNYGEIMGESGVAGLVELRFGAPTKAGPLTFAQTYAFADSARIWNPTNIPGYRSASLSSAGVGLRMTLQKNVVIRAELAKPLSRRPFDRDKKWRPLVSLSAAF